MSVDEPHPPYIEWAGVRAKVLEPILGKPVSELSTPDEIAAAFQALPTRYYTAFAPDLLYQLWRERRMTAEALGKVLLDVWRYSDFPTGAYCPARAWRAMFKTTGFLSDGIEKPHRPRLLYRACTARGRHGMSWTTKRYVAEKFIDYWLDRGQAERLENLYKTLAPPTAILAAIRGKLENIDGMELPLPVQSESEFIVDARALAVTLVETGPEYMARIKNEEARALAKWHKWEKAARKQGRIEAIQS